jgi:hypothetical protein
VTNLESAEKTLRFFVEDCDETNAPERTCLEIDGGLELREARAILAELARLREAVKALVDAAGTATLILKIHRENVPAERLQAIADAADAWVSRSVEDRGRSLWTVKAPKPEDLDKIPGAGAVKKWLSSEHAIARRVLEAVKADLGYEIETQPGRMYKEERNLARAQLEDAIDAQLAKLSARNFEIVEIPQGESCCGCIFGKLGGMADLRLCENPMCPEKYDQPEMSDFDFSGIRSDWCHARYGHKEEQHD